MSTSVDGLIDEWRMQVDCGESVNFEKPWWSHGKRRGRKQSDEIPKDEVEFSDKDRRAAGPSFHQVDEHPSPDRPVYNPQSGFSRKSNVMDALREFRARKAAEKKTLERKRRAPSNMQKVEVFEPEVMRSGSYSDDPSNDPLSGNDGKSLSNEVAMAIITVFVSAFREEFLPQWPICLRLFELYQRNKKDDSDGSTTALLGALRQGMANYPEFVLALKMYARTKGWR